MLTEVERLAVTLTLLEAQAALTHDDLERLAITLLPDRSGPTDA